MPQLRTVEEWTKKYRQGSGILNPENLFDKQGRPKSSKSYSFPDKKSYLEELVSLRHDAFGPKGLVENCKEKLREEKSRWQYHQKNRNRDVKDKPTGDFAITINRLTAKLKVYREEARAINSELAKEEKHESEILAQKQKKFAGQGSCKLSDGLIARCDFRDVEYKDGKPYFIDDGSDVQEYRAECKKVMLENAQAAKKALRLEQEEIERNNSQKIVAKKKAVETQLNKIRRRKEAA